MRPRRPSAFREAGSYGLVYRRDFLSPAEREAILAWLERIRPIWEYRYSQKREPPPGETQRRLLRPVYWLGAWQFACLNYYRPPKGVAHRCLAAEPFPPALERVVRQAEKIARSSFRREDIPPGWRLNTCLVNFYGRRIEGGKWIDTARVGEHRDFEPGPVASLSLGERALFQFVRSQGRGLPGRVVKQQWLDDGGLQIFAGRIWKDELFHRVQRVDRRQGVVFPIAVDGFEVRRVNFTFRHVPTKHIEGYADLPAEAKADVEPYLRELARASAFFRREIG